MRVATATQSNAPLGPAGRPPPRRRENRKEIAVNAYFPVAPTAPVIGRIAAVAAALLLAGCGHQTTAVRYDHAHPIAVSIEPYLMELPADVALSGFDAQRIDAFGRAFLRSGEDAVTIAYPSDVDSAAVVNAAAARLKAVGLSGGQVLRGPYSREAEGDRGVVLSYYAPAAIPSECPADKHDATRDYKNQTPSYFGCAYQNNVAVMLEEPRDAAAPRPATPPSADRRFQVLSQYAGGRKTASETSGQRTKTTDE